MAGAGMSVSNERFRQGDVFIDDDFEDVMFRYDAPSRRFFRKFYGESQESEVPHDNRLLNDAIRFGMEMDAASYHFGKPR
jgi:hypothetical protein